VLLASRLLVPAPTAKPVLAERPYLPACENGSPQGNERASIELICNYNVVIMHSAV
jgi:hypothetical protein